MFHTYMTGVCMFYTRINMPTQWALSPLAFLYTRNTYLELHVHV